MGKWANRRRREIVQEVEERDRRRFEDGRSWEGVYAAEATRQRLERERLKVSAEREREQRARQRVDEGEEKGEERISDPQVVRTESLMEIVDRFIATWDGASSSEVASANGRANSGNLTNGREVEIVNGYGPPPDHVVPLTASAYLCEKAGLTWDQLRNLQRRRSLVTPLSTADALLSAMGCPQAMYDGRIQVVPNPRWGLDRWEDWMRLNGGCISDEVGFTNEAGS